MNARNDVKSFDRSLDLRLVLVAARLRTAAWVDLAVARWLARCASNVEAAQMVLPDRKLPAWSADAVRGV